MNWINAEAEPPPTEGHYCACDAFSGEVMEAVFTDHRWFAPQKYLRDHETVMIIELTTSITHWMPLPAPPAYKDAASDDSHKQETENQIVEPAKGSGK